MADDLRHPVEALQEAVDGRLDGAALAALDAHLAVCERCRREIAALRLVKGQLAAVRTADEAVAGFDVRLRRALDEEDRATANARRRRWSGRSLTPWIAAAAALIAAAWVASRFGPPTVPEQAAADLKAFTAGTLSLPLQSTEPSAVQAYIERSPIPFEVRVFDFAMMNYQLVGGRVHQIADQPSALFAYRGPDGQVVVCQMYEGQTATLPPPAEQRTHDGLEFLIYRQGDITLVFWQEGDVVCVLTSNADPETAINLAFAKAVKV